MRGSSKALTDATRDQQTPAASWPTASSGSWRSQNVGAGAPLARLLRHLPLSVLVTAAVTALPVAIAAQLASGGRGVMSICLSAALAMVISVGVASALAAIWRRWSRSRELLFGDLLLWGWARRLWAEWHLLRTRAQFESIAGTGTISITLLERVTRVLQARDPLTHGHSQRVTRHAVRIARAMALSPEQVAKIRVAAAVHDVGKIYTPQAILNNPGKLSDEEFEIVKRHAADGAGMVGPAGDREITAMVRHHHERLSGHGYPDGLAGERIPLGARIIAVADCFDAITSTRTYRKARSHKIAFDILAKEAGSELDADVVAALRHSYSSRRTLTWAALATLVTMIPQRTLVWLQGAEAGLGVGSLPQLLPVVGAAGALALAPHGHYAQRLASVHTAQSAAASAHSQQASTAPLEQGTIPRSKTQPAAGTRHARTRPRERGPIASVPSPATPKRQGGAGNSSTPKGSGGGGSNGGGPSGGSSSGGGSGSNATGTGTASVGGPSTASLPPSTTSTSPAPTPAPVGNESGPSQTTATVATPAVPLPVPEVSVKTPTVANVPSVSVTVGGGNGSPISIGLKIGG